MGASESKPCLVETTTIDGEAASLVDAVYYGTVEIAATPSSEWHQLLSSEVSRRQRITATTVALLLTQGEVVIREFPSSSRTSPSDSVSHGASSSRPNTPSDARKKQKKNRKKPKKKEDTRVGHAKDSGMAGKNKTKNKKGATGRKRGTKGKAATVSLDTSMFRDDDGALVPELLDVANLKLVDSFAITPRTRVVMNGKDALIHDPGDIHRPIAHTHLMSFESKAVADAVLDLLQVAISARAMSPTSFSPLPTSTPQTTPKRALRPPQHDANMPQSAPKKDPDSVGKPPLAPEEVDEETMPSPPQPRLPRKSRPSGEDQAATPSSHTKATVRPTYTDQGDANKASPALSARLLSHPPPAQTPATVPRLQQQDDGPLRPPRSTSAPTTRSPHGSPRPSPRSPFRASSIATTHAHAHTSPSRTSLGGRLGPNPSRPSHLKSRSASTVSVSKDYLSAWLFGHYLDPVSEFIFDLPATLVGFAIMRPAPTPHLMDAAYARLMRKGGWSRRGHATHEGGVQRRKTSVAGGLERTANHDSSNRGRQSKKTKRGAQQYPSMAADARGKNHASRSKPKTKNKSKSKSKNKRKRKKGADGVIPKWDMERTSRGNLSKRVCSGYCSSSNSSSSSENDSDIDGDGDDSNDGGDGMDARSSHRGDLLCGDSSDSDDDAAGELKRYRGLRPRMWPCCDADTTTTTSRWRKLQGGGVPPTTPLYIKVCNYRARVSVSPSQFAVASALGSGGLSLGMEISHVRMWTISRFNKKDVCVCARAAAQPKEGSSSTTARGVSPWDCDTTIVLVIRLQKKSWKLCSALASAVDAASIAQTHRSFRNSASDDGSAVSLPPLWLQRKLLERQHARKSGRQARECRDGESGASSTPLQLNALEHGDMNSQGLPMTFHVTLLAMVPSTFGSTGNLQLASSSILALFGAGLDAQISLRPSEFVISRYGQSLLSVDEATASVPAESHGSRVASSLNGSSSSRQPANHLLHPAHPSCTEQHDYQPNAIVFRALISHIRRLETLEGVSLPKNVVAHSTRFTSLANILLLFVQPEASPNGNLLLLDAGSNADALLQHFDALNASAVESQETATLPPRKGPRRSSAASKEIASPSSPSPSSAITAASKRGFLDPDDPAIVALIKRVSMFRGIPYSEAGVMPATNRPINTLPRKRLRLVGALGEGQYGQVFLADCVDATHWQKNSLCAVKVVKKGATMAEKDNFLEEIRLTALLARHRNIVSFVGATTVLQPWLLAIEYMPHGDLRGVLKDFNTSGYVKVTAIEFLKFAMQALNGLCYIAAHKYMHIDVALRNCLLGHRNRVKICDFGLSKKQSEDGQARKISNWGGHVPIRSLPPESLFMALFSEKSDAWAFGVLLWELFSYGITPYVGKKGLKLQQAIQKGLRLAKPSNCPDSVYDLCKACWDENPRTRPFLEDIRRRLAAITQEIVRTRDEPFRDVGVMVMRVRTLRYHVGSDGTSFTGHRVEAESGMRRPSHETKNRKHKKQKKDKIAKKGKREEVLGRATATTATTTTISKKEREDRRQGVVSWRLGKHLYLFSGGIANARPYRYAEEEVHSGPAVFNRYKLDRKTDCDVGDEALAMYAAGMNDSEVQSAMGRGDVCARREDAHAGLALFDTGAMGVKGNHSVRKKATGLASAFNAEGLGENGTAIAATDDDDDDDDDDEECTPDEELEGEGLARQDVEVVGGPGSSLQRKSGGTGRLGVDDVGSVRSNRSTNSSTLSIFDDGLRVKRKGSKIVRERRVRLGDEEDPAARHVDDEDDASKNEDHTLGVVVVDVTYSDEASTEEGKMAGAKAHQKEDPRQQSTEVTGRDVIPRPRRPRVLVLQEDDADFGASTSTDSLLDVEKPRFDNSSSSRDVGASRQQPPMRPPRASAPARNTTSASLHQHHPQHTGHTFSPGIVQRAKSPLARDEAVHNPFSPERPGESILSEEGGNTTFPSIMQEQGRRWEPSNGVAPRDISFQHSVNDVAVLASPPPSRQSLAGSRAVLLLEGTTSDEAMETDVSGLLLGQRLLSSRTVGLPGAVTADDAAVPGTVGATTGSLDDEYGESAC